MIELSALAVTAVLLAAAGLIMYRMLTAPGRHFEELDDYFEANKLYEHADKCDGLLLHAKAHKLRKKADNIIKKRRAHRARWGWLLYDD